MVDPTLAQKVPVDADLLEHFGLRTVLEDLRSRKLRSTFAHCIADIPGEETPINPKCAAGSLVEVAIQPAAEDERNYELFDERALRAALVLSEDQQPVPQPQWLSVDQPWNDEDRKRRKKHKKKRKRKKKDSGGEETGGATGDSDRRKYKKRKREPESDRADTDGDMVTTDANLSQS